MQRFMNKTILVTGGTSGIGRATAKRLTDEGARLVLTGQSPEHIAETREMLPTAIVLENDAAEPAGADALANAVHDQVRRIDGAFLNAGIGRFATLDQVSVEQIDLLTAVNLRAPLLQTKALAPLIEDGGALLLIDSATVGSPRADMLVYSATKAAVRQAVRSLATEFAPCGIRVNVVAPGATETNFHPRAGMSEEERDEYKKKTANSVPLKRLGRPEDVAAVACFLLSDDAAYVTGSEYRVDGGLTMA